MCVVKQKGFIMNVSPVSMANVRSVARLNECEEPKEIQTNLLKQDAPCDSVNFKGRSEGMSDSEKKELISAARTKAAGWSVFGGAFSTLYYALRSEKTVAEKFNLDPVEDKDLVKRIKKEQVKYALPGIMEWGLVAWIYSKFVADAEDIKL